MLPSTTTPYLLANAPSIFGITVTSTSAPLALILTLGTIAMAVGIVRAFTQEPKGLNTETLKRILRFGQRVLTFMLFFAAIVYILKFGVHLYTVATEVIPEAWTHIGTMLGPQATVVGASLGLSAAIITVIVNHNLAKKRAREEWQRQSIFDLLDSTDDILLDYQKQFTHTCRQMTTLSAAGTSDLQALETAKDAYIDLKHIQNRFRANIGRIARLYPKNIYFRGSTMEGFDKILGKITHNFESSLGMDETEPGLRIEPLPAFDQEATTKLLFKLTEAFDVISYSTKELITADAVGSLAYKIMGLMTMLGFGDRTEEEPHHETPGHKDVALILADTMPISIKEIHKLSRRKSVKDAKPVKTAKGAHPVNASAESR